MALDYLRAWKGLEIDRPQQKTTILNGLVDPNTLASDSETLGSLFLRKDISGATDVGEIWLKAYADADDPVAGQKGWKQLASTDYVSETVAALSSGVIWRREQIKVVTSDAPAVNFDTDATLDPATYTFTDEDGTNLTGDPLVEDDYVIFDCNGSPKLVQVVNVDPGVTDQLRFRNAVGGAEIVGSEGVDGVREALPTIVAGNIFYVKYYLANDATDDNESAQEGSAILVAPKNEGTAGAMIVVADMDFGFGDAITMRDWLLKDGDVSGADTIQIAIEKLEQTELDMEALSGVDRNDTTLGVWSGSPTSGVDDIYSGTETIKSAFTAVANKIGDSADLSAELRSNGTQLNAGNTLQINLDLVDAAIGGDDDISPNKHVLVTNNVHQNLSLLANNLIDTIDKNSTVFTGDSAAFVEIFSYDASQFDYASFKIRAFYDGASIKAPQGTVNPTDEDTYGVTLDIIYNASIGSVDYTAFGEINIGSGGTYDKEIIKQFQVTQSAGTVSVKGMVRTEYDEEVIAVTYTMIGL